jgi:2-keto-4-pentenoate hydratase/2-oxohepta-3-ene-1,7-dioic acid hydratase in catechol pathway
MLNETGENCMKLASLKHGRDGKLVVVSNDLAWCADATAIAPTLQAALDNWEQVEADLRNLATDLEHETIPMLRFHERQAASPLPRAYQWADGSAYVNHVALVRQARGQGWTDILGTPGAINNSRTDGIRQIFLQDPDGYWIEVNDALKL